MGASGPKARGGKSFSIYYSNMTSDEFYIRMEEQNLIFLNSINFL